MKILIFLFFITIQSVLAEDKPKYQKHISPEAIQLFEKAVEFQKKKQFKEARPLLNKAIGLHKDFELARLHRNLKVDCDYLIKARSKISPEPYYAKGEFLITRKNQKKEGLKLLLEGARIGNTGIIIADIKKDGKPFNASMSNIIVGKKNTITPKEKTNLRRFLVKDKIYFLGFDDIVKYPDNELFIEYGQQFTESKTVKIKLGELTVGEAYQPLVVSIATKEKIEGEIFNLEVGKVKIEGETDHSGVKVVISDPYGKNRGFKYEAVTDKNGDFKTVNLPKGTVYLRLIKPGYITYDFGIEVEDDGVSVLNRYEIDRILILPDNDLEKFSLSDVIMPLYKTEKYKITYTVQTKKGVKSFVDGNLSKGTRSISVNEMPDWSRGGYHRSKSAIKFLNKNYNKSAIDLVLYRQKSGAYIGCQKGFKNQPPRIATLDQEYANIDKVPEDLHFKYDVPLVVGHSYILKLNQDDGDYFVKFTLAK